VRSGSRDRTTGASLLPHVPVQTHQMLFQ
jgi:hypothetical protein